MKRINRILPVYAADISGVCSALYELGGMTVMHDASGCNSTYTTHDEPRWYSMDSMVYISALSELEAVMGMMISWCGILWMQPGTFIPDSSVWEGRPFP